MRKTIEQIILDNAKKESDSILFTAKENAELKLKEAKQQIDAASRSEIDAFDQQLQETLTSLKQTYQRELKLEVEKVKQQVIESLFDQVFTFLKGLKGKELLDFVASKIKMEKTSGNEVIKVSKKDYPVYLSALSTQKGALVDCDLLNSALGKASFKLSNEPEDIDGGFLLVGDVYDLNFSLASFVEALVKKYEQEIYERLG